jgi:hypothetical protein
MALGDDRVDSWVDPDGLMSATTPEQRVGKRAEQKRRWDRENNRGECGICGAVTWNRKTRCGKHDVQHERAWRFRKAIQDRYLAGMPVAQIAAELGKGQTHVEVEMVRMRRDGWDLPYRYNVKNGKRVPA